MLLSQLIENLDLRLVREGGAENVRLAVKYGGILGHQMQRVESGNHLANLVEVVDITGLSGELDGVDTVRKGENRITLP